MKTKHAFFGLLFSAGSIGANAQVTQATNAPLSTSYVGTSSNLDVIFKRQAIASGSLSATATSFGVNSASMPSSVSFGVNAGQYSSGVGTNTYVGQNAGRGDVINSNSGGYNTFIGGYSGYSNTTGQGNVFVGEQSGATNGGGNYNTYIGYRTGTEEHSDESGNVFIGASAGFSESEVSNKLIIGNDESKELIWGDFALDLLKLNGKVGIGGVTTFPATAGSVDVSGYQLFVTGGILTDEVRVNLSSGGTWADYVFAKGYKLPTLDEVEQYIADKGVLPNMPSAAEVKENGIALGEMSKIQQEKIEELTLYIIEQNKINEKQSKEIEELKTLVKALAEKK